MSPNDLDFLRISGDPGSICPEVLTGKGCYVIDGDCFREREGTKEGSKAKQSIRKEKTKEKKEERKTKQRNDRKERRKEGRKG